MASLKDAQQLTKGLQDLVGQLGEELKNGNVDFEKLVSISDEISERADGIAETFSNVNDTLMERLQQASSGAGGGGSRSSSRKETSRTGSGGSDNG
jgi:ABC-type transporter Mla subunit MlaD